MRRCLVAVLSLSMYLAACGGKMEWPGDPAMFGVDVTTDPTDEPDPAVVNAPDFRARLRHVLEAATVYQGHDTSELAGLRLVMRRDRIQYDNPLGLDAAGMTYTDSNTIEFVVPSSGCIEDAVIPHELVHYFHGGDPYHMSPEFRLWYFKSLWESLHEGLPGDCGLFWNDYAGQWASPAGHN